MYQIIKLETLYAALKFLNNVSRIESCNKTKEEFMLFILDGINIVVNDDIIMSIVNESVIKVSKGVFVKKPKKKVLKNYLENRNIFTEYSLIEIGCTRLFFGGIRTYVRILFVGLEIIMI